MNKKMLIALGASVFLSTAAFAADTTSSDAANTSTGAPVVAPTPPSSDVTPTKPPKEEVNKANEAKSSDKTTEGKCAGGKCAAGKCSGAPK
ncbi:MAG: hypothetical protein K0R48_378 [Gammaproteobacteria bacterium]|nr:hypothetical protein [Gammaproteobacteria bacterium]